MDEIRYQKTQEDFDNFGYTMGDIVKDLNVQPGINVVDKDIFSKRIELVFDILHEKLAKSFGPGGAGTFISRFPAYFNTKDGFTIMKNIQFDTKLDMIISDMVSGICNRLNFTVGDGTTTAVIATQSTYKSYLCAKDYFDQNHILPRDIIYRINTLKDKILSEIDKKAISIRSDDPEVLKKNIADVVYISSNGNAELTEMISNLYKELMYPAITCSISKDGTTRATVIDGYKNDLILTDKMYVNNDNNTMKLNSADFIVFDHTVMKETYEQILKPLANSCKQRGRHLICIAPYYDEKALSGVIQNDLNKEYRATKDISLVLTVCNKTNAHSKKLLADFAMLLNTPIITSVVEKELIETMNAATQYAVEETFNLDSRKIPGAMVAVYGTGGFELKAWNESITNTLGNETVEQTFRVGYADDIEIGLKESIFHNFYYDENVYKLHVKEAKDAMDEAQRQAEANGTFSFDLIQAQQRYYSLGLKTGVIEVGASSEITQGYLKDTMDDSVKAAASAFNNGIVLGCNVNLTKILGIMEKEATDKTDQILLNILKRGFTDVYRTVLNNVFKDTMIHSFEEPFRMIDMFLNGIENNTNYPSENYASLGDEIMGYFETHEVVGGVHRAIIDYSIESEKVFNLETGMFSSNIVNSAETDKEILKATIDLLSLLITGNQLVLS